MNRMMQGGGGRGTGERHRADDGCRRTGEAGCRRHDRQMSGRRAARRYLHPHPQIRDSNSWKMACFATCTLLLCAVRFGRQKIRCLPFSCGCDGLAVLELDQHLNYNFHWRKVGRPFKAVITFASLIRASSANTIRLMVGSDELRRQTSEVFSISIMVVWNIEWGCDVRTVLGRSDGLVPLCTRTHVPGTHS